MKPSFFIVGAPKAGTTSLNDYLSQYEDIFIPAVKELHHFGSDLASHARENSKLTREQYLQYFEGASPSQVAGESSVLYLSSDEAASEIYEFNPDAKIIIMLRNPVDLAQSLHAQLLSQGDENEKNFLTAWEIEPARREGRYLPERIEYPDDGLYYSHVGSLGSHVKKYRDIFGPEQVLFVWFEEFTTNPLAAIAEVRSFLGLPTSAKKLRLDLRNPHTLPRSKLVAAGLSHPSARHVSLAKRLLPRSKLVSLQKLLRDFNQRQVQKEPLPPWHREMLEVEFAQEVRLLSQVTGRELTKWLPAADRVPEQLSGVSCVIPYFNSSLTIERALNSVMAQTEPVKEVIVVDDGSYPEQRQALEALANQHPSVKTLRLDSNMGAAAARNKGWDHASGAWVAFLDADDSWHHQKIEMQLKALAAHPEVAIMGHPVEVCQESHVLTETSFQDISERVLPVTATQFMVRNRWPTPSVIVRANIPLRFDETLRRSEDYEMWVRLLREGFCGATLGTPLTFLHKARFGVDGLSGSLTKSAFGELAAIRVLRKKRKISAPEFLVWSCYSALKSATRFCRR